ncbi:MAG: efflux RND transporter periplasmic adaptor subunit [Anaerolineales bacterium]|nr:efflux RND transporter periplasmic adaptor subunit [Anaerolineales bacterium]
MKKVVIVILLLALAGGGYYAYTQFLQPKQSANPLAQLETAQLEEGELITSVSAIGKVRTRQSATVSWQTSGSVGEVLAEVGEQVKAGDVLARLTQDSLPQSVINAQADLYSAQQALENLDTEAETAWVNAMQNIVKYEQAVRDAQYQLDNFTIPANQADMDAVEAVDATKKQLDEARAAFEPYKFRASSDAVRERLLEDLNQAQSDYNTAVRRLQYEYDLQVAQANLSKARQDYEKWKDGPEAGEVEAAKARITAAEITLKSAWVDAPIGGTITEAKPLVGDQVSPSTVAFRIDDLSQLFVDVQISEIDINQIKVGQQVTMTMDAIRGKKYNGNVSKIALIGSESSSLVNYTVTVELADPDDQVRPGMTAEVEIIVERNQTTLLIPNQAIQVKDGKQIVYILKPGEGMAPVEITTGASSDTFTELASGELKPGDMIVLNPPDENAQEQGPGGMFMMGGGRPRDADDGPSGDEVEARP